MSRPIKRIAIEEAFVTQQITDEWAKVLGQGAPGELGFRKMGETILAESPGMCIIHERLVDLGALPIWIPEKVFPTGCNGSTIGPWSSFRVPSLLPTSEAATQSLLKQAE